MLTSELQLMDFNPGLEIIAASGADEYSIGVTICHKLKGVKLKVVVYTSRMLISDRRKKL